MTDKKEDKLRELALRISLAKIKAPTELKKQELALEKEKNKKPRESKLQKFLKKPIQSKRVFKANPRATIKIDTSPMKYNMFQEEYD